MIGLFRKPPASKTLTEALGDHYNAHELRVIDRTSTTIELEEGQILTTEGAVGREVLLLLEGTAAVSRAGQSLATVGPGDVIGEIAVLKDQPRNAAVMATTSVKVAVFSRSEFMTLLNVCPRLNQEFRVLAEERASV